MGKPSACVPKASVASVLVVCLVALFVARAVQAQEFAWAKRAGGFSFDLASAIAVDAFGNSYVTGEFETTATFGSGEDQETMLTSVGSLDIFLAKYSTDGLLLWAKRAGGAEADQGSALIVSPSGDTYMLGLFNASATFGAGESNETTLTTVGATSNLYVAKYNANGTLVWARQAGGADSNDHAGGIAVDAMGNSYVIGYFSASATFGAGEANETTLTSAGSRDIFIARYDADGRVQWARRVGGTGVDLGLDLAVDASGTSSYVVGYIEDTVTFGAGETNETTLTSAGDRDIFIARYDADGMLMWVQQAGGPGGDLGVTLALDAAGTSYVAGQFEDTATFGAGEANETMLTSTGANDVFIAHYDAEGALLWATQAGGPNSDLGLAVALGASGTSYVAGQFDASATFGAGEANETMLTTEGEQDIFIAQYDAEGAVLWAKQAGGPDPGSAFGDLVAGMALDEGGNVYVAGQFEGSATFGIGETQETTLMSRGGTDIFVAKYGDNIPTHLDEPSALPVDFTLAQNYPNPFNPRTIIQYGLPAAAFVRLAIYDAMGRRVQTLLVRQQAAGWHEVVFDADALPSGVYFYRLESGFSARMGQMLLVK